VGGQSTGNIVPTFANDVEMLNNILAYVESLQLQIKDLSRTSLPVGGEPGTETYNIVIKGHDWFSHVVIQIIN
jgi:hypothetical protein